MAGPGPHRSDAARAAAEEAAARARVAARESVTWLRDEASRLHENYSKQSKYFKWKSWIVGGYALVSLSSASAAYLKQHNALKAHVLSPTYLDHLLQLGVNNESPDDWTHTKFILNGEYEFDAGRVSAGQIMQVDSKHFHRRGSPKAVAPNDVPFRELTIECDQGSFTQEAE